MSNRVTLDTVLTLKLKAVSMKEPSITHKENRSIRRKY